MLACRPDAITVPDLDQLFASCLNLALEDPFGAADHMNEALVSVTKCSLHSLPVLSNRNLGPNFCSTKDLWCELFCSAVQNLS